MKLMNSCGKWAVSAIMAAAFMTGSALADGWTFPVLARDGIRKTAMEPLNGTVKDYKALDKSEVTKKWSLCLLVPHTTNDILRAYIWGTVDEVKRLGAKLTTFDAGGYANVDKQLAQFDDCVTLGVDAIMIMAVSPTAFGEKIKEARAKGVKVIDLNIGVDAEVDGRVVVTFKTVGAMVGQALAAAHAKGTGVTSVVVMPGPAGVSWAEDMATGVKDAVAGSDIKIEKVVYGAPGKLDQQPLVEDVLTTYPNLNYIAGMGSSVEAALNILREQGRTGQVKLYGTWLTPDVIKGLKDKTIDGVVLENSVMVNRVAADMAIRILEGKATMLDVVPVVTMVDGITVDAAPAANFAPDGWQIEMTVE